MVEFERKLMIAWLLGYIHAAKPQAKQEDENMILDQILIKINQPPLTTEEKKDMLMDFVAEIDVSLSLIGMNRREIRRNTKH